MDSPTSDIVITVYDKFSVSARNNVTFSVSQNGKDDNNGAMIGQVVIPLVTFLTTKGVVKPEPQWYEVLPPSRALVCPCCYLLFTIVVVVVAILIYPQLCNYLSIVLIDDMWTIQVRHAIGSHQNRATGFPEY